MITRRDFLIASGSILLAPTLFADEFEAYKKAQTVGVEAKKSEFEAYKQAVDQAFNSYKKKIGAIWGDEEIGDNKKWANYSADKRSRSIVDFEKGEIKLEIIAPKGDKTIAKQMRDLAEETITISEQDAFNNDEALSSIEKLSGTPSKPLSDRPLLADFLTGKERSTKAQTDTALAEALKSSIRSNRPAKESGMQIHSLSIPLKQTNIDKRANSYKQQVQKHASLTNVDPALVMAIMHSESSFNPMAKSHIPAFGLMQIVPRSAGLDATKKLYGKERLLSASELYQSETNIQIGSVYIGILYHNYLASIKNPESRIYCTIAAYNTGSGNVARAFGARNINAVSGKINSMSPRQVYTQLLSSLPYAETKRYIEKVTPRYNAYRTMFA